MRGEYGTTVDVFERAMGFAEESVKPLVDDITAALKGASGYEQARKRLDSALEKHAGDQALADMIAQPAAFADLLGRLMVAWETDTEPTSNVLEGAKKSHAKFATLPWDEAVAYFRDRGVVKESDLEKLLDGYDEQGEEARQLMLETLQARVYESIQAAMDAGTVFDEWAEDVVANVIEPLGLDGPEPHYLEMVMRTNVLSSYGKARTAQMEDPDVIDAWPYWQKMAVGDGRTRATHMLLDGLVFEHGNDETDQLRGTIGYNCRCSDAPVSSDYSGPIQRETPEGFEFDEGWI